MEKVKIFDLFGYKFNMKINEKDKLKTSLGGLGSIIMIILFIILFVK